MMPFDACYEQLLITVEHHFAGGVYAKATRIPAGVVLAQHRHKHAHLSILSEGAVMVEVDGEMREVNAPACLNIEAGKAHKVTAVADSLWYCIHACEHTEAALADEALIA